MSRSASATERDDPLGRRPLRDQRRALVRRLNAHPNDAQPMYPMSVVNHSFTKHLEAKAIEARSLPKHENAKMTHPTQRMYLPYERTRSDFPSNTTGDKLAKMARDIGPGWWPGREEPGSQPPPSVLGGGGNGFNKGGGGVGGRGSTGSRVPSSLVLPLPSSSSALQQRARTPPGFLMDAGTSLPMRRPGYDSNR
eukprot:CAMPEP_0171874744 /NCGR_PEP_ID=MMETSP0992-20121227/35150_1 /TAXON_ID=483369 /ORGANISM="non described non described, Strain CCMP2098" /LENGTH=194 /DNA_ID=CAMNT_0012499595 /DNA_START=66 /DNA_END=651 /DNA_ORIENTATION=+